ncbi:protease modulator HflC [uncultured Ferrovibrio sp.]|jgi:membrane protease subunit HflC|uniref:protease modulator HflC n=1 Tax=uncultured Ferrovibrio sp. TaxID=1576913 RepID=UPI0026322819|nr:protease modulator HflC [uncultured Ferrovibrio sp.]
MNRSLLTLLVIVVVVLGFIVKGSVFTVHQAQQALVVQFGDPRRVISEPGLNFKIPLIQDVVYFDKRILGLDAQPEEVLTSDQRRLVVDSFVRYRITNPLLFYQTVRNEFGLRGRLAPSVANALRGAFGKLDAVSIISGDRPSAMQQVFRSLQENAQRLGIEVVDVRVKRADFPDAISQAIFRRMQTERQREANEQRATGFELAERIRAEAERQRTVLLAEARRKSEILRGEGDAERTRIFAEAASRDPQFYDFYRSLQAYSKALQQSDTTMVLSPDSDFFRYFENPAGTPRRSPAQR